VVSAETDSSGNVELKIPWNESVKIQAVAMGENGHKYTGETGYRAFTTNGSVEIKIRTTKPKPKDYSTLIYVYDFDKNTPIEGAKVVLADDTMEDLGETNSDGYARVIADPKGTKVRVQAEEYFPSREFTIVPKQTYRVALKETPDEGNLLVKVYDITGNPAGGVTVMLYDENGTPLKTGYTDATGERKGQALFTHVPAGKITVKAALGGLYEADGTVEVKKNEQAEISLNLDMYAHITVQVYYLVRGVKAPVAAAVKAVSRAGNVIDEEDTNEAGRTTITVPVNVDVKIVASVEDKKAGETYTAATEYNAYQKDAVVTLVVQKPAGVRGSVGSQYRSPDQERLPACKEWKK